MSQSTSQSFRVECPECDVAHESDEFKDTSQFADKHNEHTGHDIEWVRAEFDYDVDPHKEWELTCYTCNEIWRFETEDAAREFREEHAEYTDNDITNSPKERAVELSTDDVEVDDARSLKSLTAELEGHYDEGVPEQAIYAQIGDDPHSVRDRR